MQATILESGYRVKARTTIGVRHLAQGIAVAVVTAAVWLGVVSGGQDPWFPVRQIEIQGTLTKLSKSDVVAAIVPNLAGFFRTDLAAVHQAVSRLPWVKRATVARQWPDTLVVWIQEQSVRAIWHDGGLVNEQGEVFYARNASEKNTLPVLSGPVGSAKTLLSFYDEITQIFARVPVAVERLSMDERRSVEVELDDGVTLVLGHSVDTLFLEQFSVVYADILRHDPRRVARVDMRYPNGFAVQWHRPGSS